MKKTREHIFDELLVLQYQGGNKESLTLLIKRWHKKMISHSYRFTKNIEASKDIVQESWILIFKKLFDLKDPALFRVWAYSIVSHKSIDWIRKQQKERRSIEMYKEEESENNAVKDSSRELIHSLKSEIQKLPDKQHIVLNLFYIENFTIQEIGNILGLKTGTVKSRLFNAREHLKKCITKNKTS